MVDQETVFLRYTKVEEGPTVGQSYRGQGERDEPGQFASSTGLQSGRVRSGCDR
jgi:hypothetical protein